jgi:hypothetical protein
MNTIGKLEFCQAFVRLDGAPMRFPERPYLRRIYSSSSQRLVLRTSRQVEKSTFLACTLLYELATRPGVRVLFVAPRRAQAMLFIQFRFQAMLESSPILSRVLLGDRPKQMRLSKMQFANGSQLFVQAAFHSADSARGISSDILMVDEYQDLRDGALPVLQETLSHSQLKRTILVGTPKLLENQLEGAYALSTGFEWTMQCECCSARVVPDERCIGTSAVVCPNCSTELNVRTGEWVARRPDSDWGEGYWINHLMVPWLNFSEIKASQSVYDLAQFKNECLGLPTTLGEHVVTRAELEACCGDQPMAQSIDDIPIYRREHVIAGIDWGGGRKSRTVVVVGYYAKNNKFVIVHVKPFRADEDPATLIRSVADVCRRFDVRWIAADGRGNGLTTNRLLRDQLDYHAHLYGIVYSAANQQPIQDETIWSWTVHRSGTIGYLYSLVRKKLLVFPSAGECAWYLDELGCELAEFNAEKRELRYVCPENQRDDALHATNYATILVNRWLSFIPSYKLAAD